MAAPPSGEPGGVMARQARRRAPLNSSNRAYGERVFFMEPGETFARLRHAIHSECGRAAGWADPARTLPFRARYESRPSGLDVGFPGPHRPVQSDAHAPQSTAGQV